MITPQAKKSMDTIFMKSVRQNLGRLTEDTVTVLSVADTAAKFQEKNIIIFTISSFIFRLLTIFHFDETSALRRYFLEGNGDRELEDVLYEKGNLCCGAMNRELLKNFGHLGMSTPYLLGWECLEFIGDLKPGHLARFEIRLPDDAVMRASICCCENAPIDFKFDEAHEEETGELEFF